MAGVAQTFTGTGGIQATDLVDLNKFSTAGIAGNGVAPTGNPGAQQATKSSADVACAAATNAGGVAKQTADAAAPKVTSSPSTASGNSIQTFTGSLGGPPPPVISGTGDRPFSVNGATFVNAAAALQRSCDVQHNACANAANSGKLAGGVAQCEQQNNDCRAAIASAGGGNSSNGNNNASTNPKTSNGGSTGGGSAATGDFGSCSDPSIKFANGLDGRKEPAFAPVNESDFNHGSALNIKVISDFICGQLQSKCKASAATVTKCQDASTAAQKQTGQASADTFNQLLGV